jgi:hypothetical protein
MEKFGVLPLLFVCHFVASASAGSLPARFLRGIVPSPPAYGVGVVGAAGYLPAGFLSAPPPPPPRCVALNQTTLSLRVGGGNRATYLDNTTGVSSTYFSVTPTPRVNESVYIYDKICGYSKPVTTTESQTTSVSFTVYCTGGDKPASLYYNHQVIGSGTPTELFAWRNFVGAPLAPLVDKAGLFFTGSTRALPGCNLLKLQYFAPTTCAVVMSTPVCDSRCREVKSSLADNITVANPSSNGFGWNAVSFTVAATNGTDISLGFVPGCLA